MKLSLSFFLIVVIISPLAIGANHYPSFEAVRATEPPVIDGVLDDSCWDNATVVTGFIDFRTKVKATEQTFARVLYDDKNLYVAFECIEPEPEKIMGVERKYDRKMKGEDTIAIQLDTFHDKSSKYSFVVNTLGTRYDEQSGSFGRNSSWDCDWDAASKVTEDRWFAEVAIPIGKLHFLKGDNVTWGINLHRNEEGLQEDSVWSYDRDLMSDALAFGTMTGLDLSNVHADRKPVFEPYVSATARTKGGDNDFSAGLDISMRLNSRSIAAVTINPDFGQVEADTDTIELRDTERFLPERRTFFNDGAELFNTPITAYYSRRIWDIDLGAKITGIGPKWNLGFLDVQGEIMRDEESHEGNFMVARLTRKVGNKSHVGALLVNSERDDGFNRVGGLDARIQMSDNFAWSAQALGMLDEGKTYETVTDYYGNEYYREKTVSKDGHGIELRFDYEKKPLRIDLNLVDISEDFSPDLGYVSRQDIRGGDTRIRISDDIASGRLRHYQFDTRFRFYENHDGDTTLRDYSQSMFFIFRNEIYFGLSRKDDFHEPYDNYETSITLGYNSYANNWRSIYGKYAHGKFEDVSYDSFMLSYPFKIGNRFTTKLTGTYRMEYGDGYNKEGYMLEDATIWLIRSVTEYNFKWDARIKLTIEQTNQDRHNVTFLYAWEPNKDFDFYFVFTDTRNEDVEEQGFFTKAVWKF